MPQPIACCNSCAFLRSEPIRPARPGAPPPPTGGLPIRPSRASTRQNAPRRRLRWRSAVAATAGRTCCFMAIAMSGRSARPTFGTARPSKPDSGNPGRPGDPQPRLRRRQGPGDGLRRSLPGADGGPWHPALHDNLLLRRQRGKQRTLAGAVHGRRRRRTSHPGCPRTPAGCTRIFAPMSRAVFPPMPGRPGTSPRKLRRRHQSVAANFGKAVPEISRQPRPCRHRWSPAGRPIRACATRQTSSGGRCQSQADMDHNVYSTALPCAVWISFTVTLSSARRSARACRYCASPRLSGVIAIRLAV